MAIRFPAPRHSRQVGSIQCRTVAALSHALYFPRAYKWPAVQIYIVFGNNGSCKNLLPEFVFRRNARFVIDLNYRDHTGHGGNDMFVTGNNV